MGHEQVNLETFLSSPLPPAEGATDEPVTPTDRKIDHPMIPPDTVEARGYQVVLAKQAVKASTLVVLPTGLGKTIVALLAAADILQQRKGKIVFLAPTRPLVQQHEETFGELLRARDQVSIGGSVSPEKRAKLFEENRVIFSTPQGMRNDLEAGRIDLAEVGLLIFDEAHRGVGEYAYVGIAEHYRRDNPEGRVLGLTASPGGDKARVREVVENLGIDQVESRDTESPDVAPYVKDTKVRWVRVKLPQGMQALQAKLKAVVDERAQPLKRARYLQPKPYVSRKDCIEAGKRIRGKLGRAKPHEKGPLFGMLLNQGVVMQALHALELLETQGIEPLHDYLLRLMREPGSKSARAFAGDPRVVDVYEKIQDWPWPSHPKVEALQRILARQLEEHPDALVIVFAQYRDTIASIVRALDDVGIRAEKFVGQADRKGDKGMSQDEQKAVLDRLRDHQFQVLVASSVAEEGLDIPRVDLVVFYEPVPSEIRLIQRRGRTGRHDMGHVAVLITEDTRDEAFMYASMNREKKMRRIVRDLGE
ncbi:MAG: helicase-related protein [Candidatus Thermoplasmatota archaeon]|nr:helicase-related protein [Candidatus Thermoplasmatota archaeon]